MTLDFRGCKCKSGMWVRVVFLVGCSEMEACPVPPEREWSFKGLHSLECTVEGNVNREPATLHT